MDFSTMNGRALVCSAGPKRGKSSLHVKRIESNLLWCALVGVVCFSWKRGTVWRWMRRGMHVLESTPPCCPLWSNALLMTSSTRRVVCWRLWSQEQGDCAIQLWRRGVWDSWRNLTCRSPADFVYCSLLLLTAHGSSLDFETGRNCDRFTLGIPYCGTQIECKFTVLEST